MFTYYQTLLYLKKCLSQSECACLHKPVNMVAFFVKRSKKIPNPKGRALLQMYRVVPITKRGNCHRKKWLTFSEWYVVDHKGDDGQILCIHVSEHFKFCIVRSVLLNNQ